MKSFYETIVLTDDGKKWTIISIPTVHIAVDVPGLKASWPKNSHSPGDLADWWMDRLDKPTPVVRIGRVSGKRVREMLPTVIPEAVLDLPVVVIEESPLHGMSVTDLAKGAGTAVTAVWIGVTAKDDMTVLLFVPAAIIILAATTAFAASVRRNVERMTDELFARVVQPRKKARATTKKKKIAGSPRSRSPFNTTTFGMPFGDRFGQATVTKGKPRKRG